MDSMKNARLPASPIPFETQPPKADGDARTVGL